jgi:hypothetical protein
MRSPSWQSLSSQKNPWNRTTDQSVQKGRSSPEETQVRGLHRVSASWCCPFCSSNTVQHSGRFLLCSGCDMEHRVGCTQSAALEGRGPQNEQDAPLLFRASCESGQQVGPSDPLTAYLSEPGYLAEADLPSQLWTNRCGLDLAARTCSRISKWSRGASGQARRT